MPIGVPRIIYCWGEELPAQWTDIYNFIFRRRMVFLMQYLDDELCNQICGLLINIHMEDRSKELEKKEMERSGVFKNASKQQKPSSALGSDLTGGSGSGTKNNASGLTFEDLLAADEDLGIEENNTLEQYTLQKITMEWLNWNAQFFDYSDEPYLFHLAETLSKDFNKGEGRTLSVRGENKDTQSVLINMFKNMVSATGANPETMNDQSALLALCSALSPAHAQNLLTGQGANSEITRRVENKNHLDVYSPFRLLANFAAQDYNLKNLLGPFSDNASPLSQKDPQAKRELFELFNATLRNKASANNMAKLLTILSQKSLASKSNTTNAIVKSSEKALSQRMLRKEYTQDKTLNILNSSKKAKTTNPEGVTISNRGLNYLDFYSYNDSYNEFRNSMGTSRERVRTSATKQTERALQEEEAKKVFVIINSFGGSVGNGITVHDALQFIKAGSLTLGLGVAASAASLALAGGTIGERYVTEGCHVMIHQPEGGIQGQASDIWIDSQEIMKIRLDVAEIYSLATYRPRHKILRDLDRDFYLTATETIQYGLADEIATNEVMHEIIEMTSKVWDYHDTKQQRLLESRDVSGSGLDTQAQG